MRVRQEIQALPRTPGLIFVVAAVVTDADGRVLITQRLPGTHMAGMWEFPGGKRTEGETRLTALRRELDEELGVQVRDARPLIAFTHEYPERHVHLDVWRVTRFDGSIENREGQSLAWVEPGSLIGHAEFELLPADRPIVTALILPEQYLITDASLPDDELIGRLTAAVVRDGVRLCQLRLPGANADRLRTLALRAIDVCRPAGAGLLLNAEPEAALSVCVEIGADGVHLPARALKIFHKRPLADRFLIGASCHDAAELDAAVRLGADFAVLGPVATTPGHPEATPLGWDRFGELCAPAPLPVYALAGMTREDTQVAFEHGAQGIAAIRGLSA